METRAELKGDGILDWWSEIWLILCSISAASVNRELFVNSFTISTYMVIILYINVVIANCFHCHKWPKNCLIDLNTTIKKSPRKSYKVSTANNWVIFGGFVLYPHAKKKQKCWEAHWQRNVNKKKSWKDVPHHDSQCPKSEVSSPLKPLEVLAVSLTTD